MKATIKITTLSLTLLFISLISYAKQVTGIVKNSNTVLSSVIVQVKNTQVKSKTNKLGEFSIEATSPNTILTFTAKDHLVKEVFVGTRDSIEITLVYSQLITVKDQKELEIEIVEDEVMEITREYHEKVKYDKGPGKIHPKSSKIMRCLSSPNQGQVFGNFSNFSSNQYNTEEYNIIRDNTYVSPLNEPLSTFSIDVDAASYSNIRRMINYGQYPNKDAVRIEEMINYFSYNYPEPKGEDPFSITTEIGAAPWNPNHQLVHIGLQGKQIDYTEANPSNLVFLIDVSGSMGANNKLPLLKSSMKLLINSLKDEDRIAIVVYAGAAGLVLPSTPISEKSTIIKALDHLQSGGSTAGGAGIKLAYKVAKENLIANGNNRIILATDGDFNVGASSSSDMVRLIEERRKYGIYLTITGFGMGNYKDGRMEQISNAGNGNYYYIDNIQEAKKVFVNEINSTLFTIAKDVKIQVEFNPTQVQSYRLIGYVNRKLAAEDFNDDKKDAGELGAGHTVTALYEIIPTGVKSSFTNDIDPLKYQSNLQQIMAVSNSDELLTVKFRYKEPNEDTSKLLVKTLKSKEVTTKNSENFLFSAAVAQFGMLLRDSEFKGDASYESVLSLANKSKGADKFGYRSEFIKMVESCLLMAIK
ncbi:MAG: von Willebrand factor type A domain-containing protein [Flavobacteriales bacterium]|nr:von Willebrand factor type A domain-containing protein [Flavobacteriales bacterium]